MQLHNLSIKTLQLTNSFDDPKLLICMYTYFFFIIYSNIKLS